jgi:hypothetical protein
MGKERVVQVWALEDQYKCQKHEATQENQKNSPPLEAEFIPDPFEPIWLGE